MAASYRRARSTAGIIVFLSLLMVAGQVAIVPLLGPGQIAHWQIAFFLVPMLAAFVAGWVILRGLHRRRTRKLEAQLQAMGYQTIMKPTEEQRENLWQRVSGIRSALDIPQSSSGLQWLATRGEAVIFEYEFVLGSGDGATLHHRTVAAWSSSSHEPSLAVGKLGWLERRVARARELKLPELAHLARKWSISGNAEAAGRFLTPPVLKELQTAPNGEMWCVGGGWKCCCFRRRLDAKNLPLFHDRARRVLGQAAS